MDSSSSPNHQSTVLVTGARGFIGSHLCTRLADEGYRLHGISRRPPATDGSGITWWEADLSDASAARRVIDSVHPRFVFHLASAVTGNRALDLVLPTFHANLTGTVNLLTALTEHGGAERVVLAGSLTEPDEDDPRPIPVSPYAASKAAATLYGRFFHGLFDLPVTFARIYMVYGPAQKDLAKLVPYTICSLLRGEAPKVSSGRRPVDWIFVRDVVEGLMRLATTPGTAGQAFDLGTGTLTTTREIVERLAALIGEAPKPLFGALPDRVRERVRAADCERSFKVLGWRAETELNEGLRRTIEWYREHLAELSAESLI